MTLSEAILARRGSNLDALRLIAALCVVVSHAWPLALGPGTAEPLENLTGHSLGGWAVLLFFFISGLLISQSAERRSTGEFWAARARRIMPGLLTGLLFALTLAIVTGATPSLYEDIRYILRGLSLFGLEHKISGAYASNPYPLAVNGPLWSLQHEVAAYLICFLAVRLGLLRKPIGLAIFAVASLALALLAPTLPTKLATFAPLFFAYALGMISWRLREIIALRIELLMVFLAIAILLKGTVMWESVATLTFAYGVLFVAYRTPVIRVRHDLSFGVYIYGWPIAQTIIFLMPGLTPMALAVASIVCTIPFAFASWTLIERPSLPVKTRAA